MKIWRFVSIAGVVIIVHLIDIFPGKAQPALQTVSASQSRGLNSKAINLEVWAGRATAIDFSQLNERIIQIFLADPSRFTYATDTPLKEGQASTVFLRKIQPLKFPNLTTANMTNLFIKTKASNGATQLYTFNVLAGKNSPKYSGLSIATVSAVELSNRTLEVGSFRKATLNDIERGLVSAIRRGYTPESDPVVTKVREFLASSRNTSSQSLVEIAQSLNLSVRVLTQLGLLGIEDTAIPRKNLPVPSANQPVLRNHTPKTEQIRLRE